MAMDVELRNSLGAITAQIAELTKASKQMDGTLAGALEKGAKGADTMSDHVRKTRGELNLVEQVSTRMARSWASQAFALATSYVGVQALFGSITDAISRKIAEAENRVKSVRSFADKSRPAAPPALLPELRQAIHSTAPTLPPEAQADVLRTYLEAGGGATPGEVKRLGQVTNAASLLGFDPKDLSTRYAKLRKQGIANPEDLIYAFARQGKMEELDKLKPGQARAQAQQNQGAWNRAVTDSRTLTPQDYEAWRASSQAAVESNKGLDQANEALMRRERLRVLESRAGILAKGPFSGPFGVGLGIKGQQQLSRAFPGKTMKQIEAEIDAQVREQGVDTSRVQQFLPQPVGNLDVPGESAQPIAAATPAAVVPPHWSTTVRPAQAPSATRPHVAEVRLVGDNRPMPINAGD